MKLLNKETSTAPDSIAIGGLEASPMISDPTRGYYSFNSVERRGLEASSMISERVRGYYPFNSAERRGHRASSSIISNNVGGYHIVLNRSEEDKLTSNPSFLGHRRLRLDGASTAPTYKNYTVFNILGARVRNIEEVQNEFESKAEQVKLSECLRTLDELRKLPKDWDSYGSEPPNSVALTNARKAILILVRMNFVPTCVTPSVENGVGISFVDDERYADIECFNSGEIIAITSDGRGSPEVWELNDSDKEIKLTLEKIRVFIRG